MVSTSAEKWQNFPSLPTLTFNNKNARGDTHCLSFMNADNSKVTYTGSVTKKHTTDH